MEQASCLYLHGIGHFHPENVIDNSFLASLDIGVDPEWILSRVGIHTRRTVLPLDYIRLERNKCVQGADEASIYSNAETGAHAAGQALSRAGLSASDIGLVITGGSAPALGSPAEACAVAAEAGIDAPSFDVNSACSTFLTQLWMVSLMSPRRLPDFILLVNPENLTRMVDYRDRTTAVLMGDATTAAVISATVPSSVEIRSVSVHSYPEGWANAVIPVRGHFHQNGSAIQRFAIKKMTEVIAGFSDRQAGDSYFIGHQANLTMLKAVCERTGIRPDKHLYNVDRFGNCGTAGAPSVMSENWDRFRSRDQLRLAVVGAGLTWAGALVDFRHAPATIEKGGYDAGTTN